MDDVFRWMKLSTNRNDKRNRSSFEELELRLNHVQLLDGLIYTQIEVQMRLIELKYVSEEFKNFTTFLHVQFVLKGFFWVFRVSWTAMRAHKNSDNGEFR